MKNTTLFVFVCMILTYSYGQERIPENYLETLDYNGSVAEKGTYQFIIRDNKFTPVFTTEMLLFAEQNRKEEMDVVFLISDNVELFIPSRRSIEKEGFTPLKEIEY